MLSFICASNDVKMFETCVMTSLDRQANRDFEVIYVDTKKKHYSSAAKAFTEGARQAKGEYLVFLHHDIEFDDAEFIDKLLQYIAQRDFLIAGVAGVVPRGKWRKDVYSNIVHGQEKAHPGLPIDETKVMTCKTVDECMFVIPRAIYEMRPMKEYIPTWHLYAVEYCLWAETKQADSVVIFPLGLWHKSAGASFNQNYYQALDKIIDAYRNTHKVIYTTMGAWPTQRWMLTLRNGVKALIGKN